MRKDVSEVEQLVEESEADLERKRSVAAAAAWGGQPPSPPADVQSVPQVVACCIVACQQGALDWSTTQSIRTMKFRKIIQPLARCLGTERYVASSHGVSTMHLDYWKHIA